ncbi:MAG TPA: RNA polymerase sigma factor [Pedobacter sp.]
MNNMPINAQICLHQPSLQIFALRFTQNNDDAHDLVQDTLLRAIRYSALYKEGTNLRGWLFTIMRNTFINNYRQSSRHNKIVETTEDLASYQLVKSADSNRGENQFISEDIHKVLNNLPADYLNPFIKYFEGYKYHEIAEELAIPIGTVKTRIHMARQFLKNKLKVYNDAYKN